MRCSEEDVQLEKCKRREPSNSSGEETESIFLEILEWGTRNGHGEEGRLYPHFAPSQRRRTSDLELGHLTD
jgi:hypothetical protein